MSSPAPHNKKSEPLLPVDRAAERPLWVVLVIMAFLAALALLSARMGERNYKGLQAQLAGQATVQLTDITTDNRRDVTQQALDVISTSAPRVTAQRLTDAEAMRLIEPWMGSGLDNLPDAIALPVLISLSESTSEQRDNLARAFEAAGISAVIDDHGEWSRDITRASRAFTIGSWLILLLTFFAGTAASIYATQSAMAAQFKTMAVFAQVGTTDNFIARLFITRTLKVSAFSAVIGAAGAIAFLIIYRMLRGPADGSILPNLTPTLSDMTMLAILCLIFSLVCAATAGVSAKQLLSRHRLYG